MLSWICALTLAFSMADSPKSALKVKDDVYLPGPPIRVGSWISNTAYSRDGKYLFYVDEQPERTYADERSRVVVGDDTVKPALVRLDIQKGFKQTLYTATPGEKLMRITPVGPGGDVLCSIVVGVSLTDQLNWRAIYCPVGAQPRVVVDGVKTRSFDAVASPTDQKAFILICGKEERAKVLYINKTSTFERPLGIVAEQGLFLSVTTRQGNPIATLQGAPPDYALLGNFELDYASGQARATDLPEPRDIPEPPAPLIQYDSIKRSEGDPGLGQVPLRDILAKPGDPKNGKGQLIVTQGVIAVLSEGPNGLSVLYLTSDGYYLREMVKVNNALKAKLKVDQR